jgi:hypothetical protein
MKNLLLLLLIIASAFTISHAQGSSDDGREKIQVGIKAGVNYSNVYDSKGDQFNANAKVGLAAGVFLGIPLGKYVGIQPEVLFSQKGFQATGTILGSSYDFTRTTNYIDVPLFLAIKPVSFLTLLVGPQFSYLLKQKDVFANGATTILQENEFENENIRKNTLCFIGGVNINVSHLVIGARAGWDSMNNNGNGTSTTPRYKNTWLQATVGFRF